MHGRLLFNMRYLTDEMTHSSVDLFGIWYPDLLWNINVQLCSQEPITGPYFKPDESSSHLCKICFNIILLLCYGHLSDLISSEEGFHEEGFTVHFHQPQRFLPLNECLWNKNWKCLAKGNSGLFYILVCVLYWMYWGKLRDATTEVQTWCLQNRRQNQHLRCQGWSVYLVCVYN